MIVWYNKKRTPKCKSDLDFLCVTGFLCAGIRAIDFNKLCHWVIPWLVCSSPKELSSKRHIPVQGKFQFSVYF